ncbi:MAG: hypothetical protein JWQ23_1866 [Herminiimonas sp.]|nr:hypothetical protein [Herminiimonas sp.]
MQLLLRQIGQSARKQIHTSFPELSGQLAAISNRQIGLLAEALDLPAPISAPVPAVPLAQTYSAQYRILTEAMATELGNLGTKLQFGFSNEVSEENAAEKFAVLASQVENLPPAEVRALVAASMNALAKGEHASAIDNPPQTAIVMLQGLSKYGGNFKSFEDGLPDYASKHFLHLIQTLAQDQLAILALGDSGAVQTGSPMRAPGLPAAAGSSVDQVAYQALGQDLAAQLGALGTNLKFGFAGVPDEKGDVPGERSAAEKFNSLAAQLGGFPDAMVRPLVAAAMNAVAESGDAFTDGKPLTLKRLFEGLSTTAGNMNHFEGLLNGRSSIRLMSMIKTEAAHQLGALSLDGIDDDHMAQVMQALPEPVNTDAHAAPIQYRSLGLSLATRLGELGAGLKHGFSIYGQEGEAIKKFAQLARIFDELPNAEADILIAASINALATGSHPLTTGKLQHAKNVLEGLTKDSNRKYGMQGLLDDVSLRFLARIAAEAKKHLPADTA